MTTDDGAEWVYSGLPATVLPSLVPVPLPADNNELLRPRANSLDARLPAATERTLARIGELDGMIGSLCCLAGLPVPALSGTAAAGGDGSGAAAEYLLQSAELRVRKAAGEAEERAGLWRDAPASGEERERYFQKILEPYWQPCLSNAAVKWIRKSGRVDVPEELSQLLQPGDAIHSGACRSIYVCQSLWS